MIQHAFNKADNVLVITHVDPDGDAISSLTAVGLALRQQGKRVTLVCDDGVPRRFAYLPMSDQVQQEPDYDQAYDLLVAVDCGDEDRMGRAYASLPNPLPLIVNIDHHATNSRFGEFALVDGEAVSTTEVLYHLFVQSGIVITPQIATSLLTGLVTDTLGFRTVGVTAETLTMAAALVEAGADLGQITMRALNLRSFSTLQMWRVGLNNMRLEDGLLWTSITDEERESVDFRSNSSLGLVNLMADVEEAAIGAVLMEMNDGTVKVGFRCRPPYDVSGVATALGGGGHKLAAGCTIRGPLEQAEARVVQLCKEAIRQQTALAEPVVE